MSSSKSAAAISVEQRRAILPLAKKLHTSLSEWGWMNESDEVVGEEDKEMLVKQKFKHVKLILCLTGLYYSKEPTTLAGKGFQLFKEIICIFAG